MDNCLPLFILLPLAAAAAVFLARGIGEQLRDVLVSVVTGSLFLLSVHSASIVSCSGMSIFHAGGGNLLVADGLSVFFQIIVNLLLAAVTVYSAGYIAGAAKTHFYGILLLLAAGLNGVILSGDLFTLFIFTELSVIPAYILVALPLKGDNFEAAFKYGVLGSLSSLSILLAIAFIYAYTGTLSLAGIASRMSSGGNPLENLAIVLLIAGFSLKATLVPFHAWVPDAYTAAPSPASAIFSGAVSKAAGIYVILRLSFNVFGISAPIFAAFMWLGAASILIAVILALYQWDMKRLLAYHSISQIGYVFLGIGTGSPLGMLGGLFHLANHSVFKSLLFLNAGSLEHAAGTRDLKELGGVARRMPVTGATSLIASLSISGIPPLNGFWSKLLIIAGCAQASRYGFGLVAAGASILTLASFLKVQRYAFRGHLKDTLSRINEVPASMRIPMIVLAILCAGMGLLLLPGLDIYFLSPALKALTGGKAYAAAVSRMIVQ